LGNIFLKFFKFIGKFFAKINLLFYNKSLKKQ
jgi:hypothetical protein